MSSVSFTLSDSVTQTLIFVGHGWCPLSFTHPLANGGAPPHDAALQPGVRSDPRSLQHRAAFYPHAVLHNHASPDGDIGADGAVLPNLCRRVLQRKARTGDYYRARVRYPKCSGNELNSPPERCRGNRAPCVASRERVVVATEGTCTSLSGSL